MNVYVYDETLENFDGKSEPHALKNAVRAAAASAVCHSYDFYRIFLVFVSISFVKKLFLSSSCSEIGINIKWRS